MPEIKNTFLKSKMNKDLDARIIPNGEYRDAKNISVSTSEGADVGALENIRGNFNLTDFGLTDNNLEVIGTAIDESKNRIYFFITNFNDSTSDNLSLAAIDSVIDGDFTINGPKHCIAYCEIPYQEDSQLNSNSITHDILVEGSFLNFSKSNYISSNILEDFLFFTDNRNQPRKINIETAIANPRTYYTREDHISVAKYAPYTPISFLNDVSSPSVSTLKNELDYWLPAIFVAPAYVYTTNAASVLVFDQANIYGSITNLPYANGRYASPQEHFGNNIRPLRIYRIDDENTNYAYVKDMSITVVNGKVEIDLYQNFNQVTGQASGLINDIGSVLGWTTGEFAIEIPNPHYNINFAGDIELLREKFVKFSYRFKYDDDEYSLLAPFSQHAFVPKQYGYFIGNDDKKTKESGIVNFMENQITTAGLVVNLPYPASSIKDDLKVKEIQLIYKASDEKSLKVIADIPSEDINGLPGSFDVLFSGGGYTVGQVSNTTGGTGSGLKVRIDSVDSGGKILSLSIAETGTGYRLNDIILVAAVTVGGKPAQAEITSLNNKFIYNYTSEKPIKVLDDQEIIRVNDIVPIRAKTQEIVGNRVIYGNFLQNKSTPSNLNYSINVREKTGDNKKEFLNHTLKQGRTYQVGLVLQDRYGRASNVIINNNSAVGLNNSFFASYTDGGVDPLRWPGNCLNVSFSQKIPTEPNATYMGVYNELSNPLGWYSYKVVVKQQDQDYYNIYVPGGVSGNIDFSALDQPLEFSSTNEVFQIPLFNDNINKIPRDLKEVGPTDDTFGSSISLFPRVSSPIKGSAQNVSVPGLTTAVNISQQNFNTKNSDVTSIISFSDLGDWTAYKNVNIRFVDSSTNDAGSGALQVTGPYVPENPNNPNYWTPADLNGAQAFYIYPGATGNIDPFFLKNNKNPLIANISTSNRIGYKKSIQDADSFSRELMVFETKAFKSNLDIYYESSNTGLISEFNTSVNLPDGATGEPVDISTFTPTLIENINTNQPVSNIFQATSSNGTVVTANNPNVTMQVSQINNQTNPPTITNANNKFTLTTVQQPTLNTPATYQVRTSTPFIFISNSEAKENYEFKFNITSNLSSNVNTVTKNVSLSNVAPSLYRLSVFQAGQRALEQSNYNDNHYLYIKNLANSPGIDPALNAFKASTRDNPLYQTITPNPSTSDFGSEVSVVQFDRQGTYGINSDDGNVGNPVLFTHFNNGAVSVSAPYNDSNKFVKNYTTDSRYAGVRYEVTEAKVYYCAWKRSTGAYYFNDFINRNWQYKGQDVKNYFATGIRDQNSNNYNYSTPSIVLTATVGQDGFPDFPLLAGGLPGGYKKSMLINVKARIVDAGNGAGHLPSGIYNYHLIISKE